MSKLTKDRNPWPVSVTGSNIADATTLTASFEDDGSGYGVMRVVDANPEAYNATDDTKQTQPVYPGLAATELSGAGASITKTVAAVAGKSHYITGINVSSSDGTARVWNLQVPLGSVALRGASPTQMNGFGAYKVPENTAFSIVVNASAGTDIAYATVFYFTK